MAVGNWINYAAIAPQKSPLEDVFAHVLQGYKMQREPAKMDQEQKQRELVSRLAELDLQHKPTEYSLADALKRAQAQKAFAPSPLTGETAQLFALRNSLSSDADRKVVDQILANKAAGSSGTTVYDPNTGQPLVQVGGSGARGAKGGGLLFNPATGEMLSQPTSSVQTNLQSRVVGAEALKPYINKITEELPQFQELPTQVSLLGQSLSNAILGTDFKLPSQKAAGNAAIKEASEAMIKTFGLNATGANRQAMEDILKPKLGESKNGYDKRIKEQMSHFLKNQALAKESLQSGIKVNNEPQKTALPAVPPGKVRVYFPDGPHVIPKKLLEDALSSGATLEEEL